MSKLSGLQALLDMIGIETRSYSGRAMYGKSCLGVELANSQQSIGAFFASVLTGLQEFGLENDKDGLEELAKSFRNMRMDQLGRGTIVYFPDIRFNDDGAEDEDFAEEEYGT